LVSDKAALSTERPATGDDPGRRLAGDRARQQLVLLPRCGEFGAFGIAREAFAVVEQYAGGILRRTAEQRVVERGDIGAEHGEDDDAAEAAVGRLPTLAHGEERLDIATAEAAGAQRPDESLRAGVLQRAKIFAAGMIEIAIDRENSRADQLASIGIDDPVRGN